MQNTQPSQSVSLFRRLAALFYDSLIVFALLIIATMLAMLINHGKTITPGNILFTIYLLLVIYSYFAFSWVYLGQTIGMRAWGLYIKASNHQRMDLWHSLLRCAFAIPSLLAGGAGFWWTLVDKRRLALHDIWSKSYLYRPQKIAANEPVASKSPQ